MTTRRRIGKIICSLSAMLAALFLLSVTATADLYWESVQEMRDMPYQKDRALTVKNYYTDDACRIESDGKIMIMDFNSAMMYTLDTARRTYTEINMKQMPHMEGRDAAGLQTMMKNMMGSVQVSPTDQTRTIAGYLCRKYNVTIMMMNGEYWVSKDVQGYDELKRIGGKMAGIFDNNPMLKQSNIAAMMDDVDGFPVQTVMQVMGGKTITTLKGIKQTTLKKDLFKVPADYSRVEMPTGGMPAFQ